MEDKAEPKFAELREDYINPPMRKSDVNPDPFQQFKKWFTEARDSGIREPNAMTLSTLGLDQVPSSRTVLLKDLDQRGFSFFTNYNSRKAKEIEAHPLASLLFLWKEQSRQVVVRGRVEKTSRAESQIYFQARPYDSRIGAWASDQSAVIPGRDWLIEKDREYRQQFPDKGTPDCVPVPDFWGGYRLLPASFEFWQGGKGRLHDRLIYKGGAENVWAIERWSP